MSSLLMAMRRGSTFSTLVTKLANRRAQAHLLPPPSSTTRSNQYQYRLFSNWFGGSMDYNLDDKCAINAHGGSFTRTDEFPTQRGTCDEYMENPFQVSGPRGAYEVKKVEEGLFVRLELPGIDKNDVKIWMEDGNLYVKGEGKKESRYEDNGRTYSGSIELNSNEFQPDQIKADFKNGVLRMMIPKARNFKEPRGVHVIRL